MGHRLSILPFLSSLDRVREEARKEETEVHISSSRDNISEISRIRIFALPKLAYLS